MVIKEGVIGQGTEKKKKKENGHCFRLISMKTLKSVQVTRVRGLQDLHISSRDLKKKYWILYFNINAFWKMEFYLGQVNLVNNFLGFKSHLSN